MKKKTVSTSLSSTTQETSPAQPTKAFFGMLVLTGIFYLIDCILVTLFQKHPSGPWIEWGIHAVGPFGFLATLVVFVAGMVGWLKEVARQADEERGISKTKNSTNLKLPDSTSLKADPCEAGENASPESQP